MRVLTKYPSVGLHFVPIVNDIDARSEAKKLQERTCKAQINHKVGVSSRSLLDFSRLLLLHDQLLLEFIDDILGPTWVSIRGQLLSICLDWILERFVQLRLSQFALALRFFLHLSEQDGIEVFQNGCPADWNRVCHCIWLKFVWSCGCRWFFDRGLPLSFRGIRLEDWIEIGVNVVDLVVDPHAELFCFQIAHGHTLHWNIGFLVWRVVSHKLKVWNVVVGVIEHLLTEIRNFSLILAGEIVLDRLRNGHSQFSREQLGHEDSILVDSGFNRREASLWLKAEKGEAGRSCWLGEETLATCSCSWPQNRLEHI